MRVIADIIDSITGSIRFIFLLGFLAVIIFGLLMTVGATLIAPDAAEVVADRITERAMQSHRNYELGQEGWGYEEPYAGSGGEYAEDGEYVGGWGDE